MCMQCHACVAPVHSLGGGNTAQREARETEARHAPASVLAMLVLTMLILPRIGNLVATSRVHHLSKQLRIIVMLLVLSTEICCPCREDRAVLCRCGGPKHEVCRVRS